MIRALFILGCRGDGRLQRAIDWLPESQLEDGGCSCDYPQFEGVRVKHSSFMSTIAPLRGYSEIPRQEWTRRMKWSIERGAEFILTHRLYKADHHEWMTVNPAFTTIHFPTYYYYDVLHGLRVLTKLGYSDDERMREAACWSCQRGNLIESYRGISEHEEQDTTEQNNVPSRLTFFPCEVDFNLISRNTNSAVDFFG